MLTYDIEKYYSDRGYCVICGIDEAGRGPLAGPVYAAACVLPIGLEIKGLNDSKKLTAKTRERLFDIITESAISFSVASASVEEIDELNILNASLLAMRRAVETLSIPADFALIDGNVSRGFDLPNSTVIGGDAKCPSIAAASILAKVSRDRVCLELDSLYPDYGFAKHKGYGTKQHYEAIEKFGITPVHRLSFLKKILNK